jgi:hypothetical protein
MATGGMNWGSTWFQRSWGPSCQIFERALKVKNPLVQNILDLKIPYFKWPIIHEFLAIFLVFKFYFIFS